MINIETEKAGGLVKYAGTEARRLLRRLTSEEITSGTAPSGDKTLSLQVDPGLSGQEIALGRARRGPGCAGEVPAPCCTRSTPFSRNSAACSNFRARFCLRPGRRWSSRPCRCGTCPRFPNAGFGCTSISCRTSPISARTNLRRSSMTWPGNDQLPHLSHVHAATVGSRSRIAAWSTWSTASAANARPWPQT